MKEKTSGMLIWRVEKNFGWAAIAVGTGVGTGKRGGKRVYWKKGEKKLVYSSPRFESVNMVLGKLSFGKERGGGVGVSAGKRALKKKTDY